MEITLTVAEAVLLRDILEQNQRELFREISRSSHHEFKRVLRDKEDCLNSLLGKLNLAQIGEIVLAGGK